jgi:hypothetical protein
MRFKKIALALFACMALGAFVANAAQAGQWTSGTTENQTGAGTKISSESVTCGRHGTTPLVLTSTVLGAPLTLKATGIECLSSTIETNAAGEDLSAGTLKFTGVTVEPSTCSVPGGTLTTAALKDKVEMDATSGSTVVFDKFSPVSGTTFVTVKLEGASCPLAGVEAPVKGSAAGEAVHTNAGGTGFESNKTGTLTKVQTLLFGSAQQTTGGGSLTLGTAAATLSGAVDNSLSGALKGSPFGAD